MLTSNYILVRFYSVFVLFCFFSFLQLVWYSKQSYEPINAKKKQVDEVPNVFYVNF